VSNDPRIIVLKLALASIERGDREAAAELLRGALAMRAPETERADRQPIELRAVRAITLAKMLDCTPRHVRDLERRGRIPPECIIGEGAGKRFLIAATFAALGKTPPKDTNTEADEIRAYVRRRSKLKLVGGAG
jgi:hypothetical protein